MLHKLKDWFSVDNNVFLVRDLLFVGTLLLALIVGLSSCAPVAYAAEPTVVKLNFDDYPSLEIPSNYTDYLIMYQDGTEVKLYVVDVLGDITTERVAELNSVCCISTPGGHTYQKYLLTDGLWTKDFETSGSSTSLNFVGSKIANVIYSLWDISLNNYTAEPLFNANYEFPTENFWDIFLNSGHSSVSFLLNIFSKYVVFLFSSCLFLAPVALVYVLIALKKTGNSIRGA